MTPYPPPVPGESWATRYLLRPVLWVVFQFSSEARFIRRKRRRP